MTALSPPRSWWAGLAIGVSSVVTGICVGAAWVQVRGDRMAPWILGRATGVTAYLLPVALVLLGLSLSHPKRALRGRSATRRMRAHVTLALLAFAMIVVHVVALATDRYAGVGWLGSLLPMHASYRPVAVTLGVLGAWIGLLAGLSAGVAGHLPVRMWFPLHRVAVVSFVLVVLHGLYAGSDAGALFGLYLATGLLVAGVAVHRYLSRRPEQLG